MSLAILRIVLVLALTLSLTQASTTSSQYSRDESNKNSNYLASTFKGGISSNRHHARAQLNSQLYPDLTQLTVRSNVVGYSSGDIDEPSAHESGGIPQPGGYPGQRSATSACGRTQPGAYHNSIATGCQPSRGAGVGQAPPPASYPTQQYPANQLGGNSPGVYPSYGAHPPAYPIPQPGFAYPGTYLPQYPAYPAGYYPGFGPGPGNLPVVSVPGAPPPPTSYQNQHNYAPHATPAGRDNWNHSFKMKPEYAEDGVHKGPFGVLNNHGGQGYGSGFGGGYNGAFSRPGY